MRMFPAAVTVAAEAVHLGLEEQQIHLFRMSRRVKEAKNEREMEDGSGMA